MFMTYRSILTYLAFFSFDFGISFVIFSFGSLGVLDVSFLHNGEVVVMLQKSDFRGLGSNNEDVLKSGRKFETVFVFNMDDFVRSFVLFLSDDSSNSSNVVSSGNHNLAPGFELEVVEDFVVSEVDFYGVIGLDKGMGESQGSSVMSDNIGNSLSSHCSSFDSAKFELSFTGGNLGKSESSLEVIKKSIIGLALN